MHTCNVLHHMLIFIYLVMFFFSRLPYPLRCFFLCCFNNVSSQQEQSGRSPLRGLFSGPRSSAHVLSESTQPRATQNLEHWRHCAVRAPSRRDSLVVDQSSAACRLAISSRRGSVNGGLVSRTRKGHHHFELYSVRALFCFHIRLVINPSSRTFTFFPQPCYFLSHMLFSNYSIMNAELRKRQKTVHRTFTSKEFCPLPSAS